MHKIRRPLKIEGKCFSSRSTSGIAILYKGIPPEFLAENCELYPKKEIVRLNKARKMSTSQLEGLILSEPKENSNVIEIIKVQLLILEDPSIFKDIEAKIKWNSCTAENALDTVLVERKERFSKIQDEVFRTRWNDIEDALKRVFRNLTGYNGILSLRIPFNEPYFIVARDLVPIEFLLNRKGNLAGVILEEGSEVSHLAIILKTLNIPLMINVAGATLQIRPNQYLFIDAENSMLHINPDKDENYLENSNVSTDFNFEAVSEKHFTKNGVRIYLEANACCIEELDKIKNVNADGIGLFRSEISYLTSSVQPSLKSEQEFYSRVIDSMGDIPVTIRLLDLGADKIVPYLPFKSESNPQLGLRGIRYLNTNEELLKKHLTAIIKSVGNKKIKLLVPFVSKVNEIIDLKRLINSICEIESINSTNILLGIMIEVPSVAFCIDSFIPYVDFMSIGTNDLFQYFFAACRETSDLAHYRDMDNPMMWDFLSYIQKKVRKSGKPLSICGELAGNPKYLKSILSLGFTNLSMSPEKIPVISKELKKINLKK